jgi:alkylation response protein AidB-like acyl-CoA dehydrogenase
MTNRDLANELRSVIALDVPLPGRGQTSERHLRLMELGKRSLSLARLAEGHFDAVAVLAEAGRRAQPGKIYGVWATEAPGQNLSLARSSGKYLIDGARVFSVGAGLIDKALLTVLEPEHRLVEIDLHAAQGCIAIDESAWKTEALLETKTATVTFTRVEVSSEDFIGDAGWYLDRPGFWHGACGTAACWAGGAEGLMEYARAQKTHKDPHTRVHLAAMMANVWAMQSLVTTAGEEIDRRPADRVSAARRALALRHLVEQACSDVLRRFARAYGPYPLAMKEDVSERYQQLDLYLRQSHGERDLEALGRLVQDEE